LCPATDNGEGEERRREERKGKKRIQ
jgi:hypothetical protein